jgi:hypothetical protein
MCDAESASRSLIVLMIITITIWIFDALSKMCVEIKRKKDV